MIFTGSRQWGEMRPLATTEEVLHELAVCAMAVRRLISRHVQGVNEDFHKKMATAQLAVPDGLVVIQGGATGADAHAARAAMFLATGLWRRSRAEYARFGETVFAPGDIASRQLADDLWLETYPADWKNLPRNEAGPARNQYMLDQGAHHVIALYAKGRPYGLDQKGGTNDMVRRSVRAGVPVDIYVAGDRAWRKP